MTSETSYTVGVAIEVGVDLGLSFGDIVSAGVSASVATTTETGNAEGAQIPCPDGPWKCALIITPAVVTVSGKKIGYTQTCDYDTSQPYMVQFPKKSNN